MRLHIKRILLYVLMIFIGSLVVVQIRRKFNNKPIRFEDKLFREKLHKIKLNRLKYGAEGRTLSSHSKQNSSIISQNKLIFVKAKETALGLTSKITKTSIKTTAKSTLRRTRIKITVGTSIATPLSTLTKIKTTVETPIVISTVTFQQTSPVENETITIDMFALHDSILKDMSDKEVLQFYSRERESEEKFGKVLDIEHDRELLSTLFPSRNEKSDRVTDQLRLKLKVNQTKTILILGMEETNEKLHESKCNISACNIIQDEKRFADADLVVYYDFIPKLPNKRRRNQAIAWFQIESAANYGFATASEIVNWTATYRHDSVLNTPYERFTPFLSIENLPLKPLRNYAHGKNKLVAWFVTNCRGKNHRLDYVNELKQYIDVDIYGGCGPLKCNRWDKSCFKMLKTDYKFYLSFENTNCADYISEKLYWNAYL